jgi:hypothetical protein
MTQRENISTFDKEFYAVIQALREMEALFGSKGICFV